MSSFHGSSVRGWGQRYGLFVLGASEPQGSNALPVRKRRSTANEICGSLKKRRYSCLGLGGPQVRKGTHEGQRPDSSQAGETNDD
jgi:hypothetical protein